tara:strand:- start:918 stop:1655 length:738 start_codon:yes stop_codon:yes gene_type:complete
MSPLTPAAEAEPPARIQSHGEPQTAGRRGSDGDPAQGVALLQTEGSAGTGRPRCLVATDTATPSWSRLHAMADPQYPRIPTTVEALVAATGSPKRKMGGQLGNKGGRRLGDTVASGRIAVGSPVREKAALLAAWKEAVSRRFDRLVEAQLMAAEGVTHMQARDSKGKWEPVTDPALMAAKLEAGEETYRLSAIAPSAPILKDILDRMFGQAKQSLDLDVTTSPTSVLSDGELAEELTTLLKKLNG